MIKPLNFSMNLRTLQAALNSAPELVKFLDSPEEGMPCLGYFNGTRIKEGESIRIYLKTDSARGATPWAVVSRAEGRFTVRREIPR